MVGRTLQNYKIVEKLGEGGMGVVYKAQDLKLPRFVVLKFLRPELLSREQAVRLEREARALASLNHPHLAVIYDYKESDGECFLVLEYLPGGTLKAKIDTLRAQREHLSYDLVIEYATQLAKGLGNAHKKGVIHRDIKSSNVLLTEEGTLKITDFGLAQLTDETQVTRPGTLVGTLAYMSPEQVQNLQIDHRSDIFSFGVLLYEMITGELPFPAFRDHKILHEIVNTPAPSIRILRPGAPDVLERVVKKALEKSREQRYQSMGELLEDLGSHKTDPNGKPPDPTTGELEIAHVLFMDLVAYSQLHMEQQTRLVQELQEKVKNSQEFRHAQRCQRLLSLPSGDGMALVFFKDPLAPVRCAIELSRQLRLEPHIRLRMGIHSGPVIRTADINANNAVAGGGINLAQRVMDSGDAGHILVSRAVAEVLVQLSGWSESLQELGEHKVKQSTVWLYNLHSDDFGNPEIPSRLQPPKPVPQRKRYWLAIKLQFGRYGRVSLMASLAALLVVAGSLGWPYVQRFWVLPVLQGSGQVPATENVELRFFLTMARFGDDGKAGTPMRVADDFDFDQTTRVRLGFVSPKPGHLYLINEGPEKLNGFPAYNVEFPSLIINNGSSQIPEKQEYQIPAESWLKLDDQVGVERMWIIFSPAAIPELEMTKKYTEDRFRGRIADQGVTEGVQEFLRDNSKVKPEISIDSGNMETTLKGNGQLLVHLLKLKHH